VVYNTFEGDLQNFMPDRFRVLEQKPDFEHQKATILLPPEATPNELLKLLIPKVIVYSLNEIIPSMNDIFISAVTKQNQTTLSQA